MQLQTAQDALTALQKADADVVAFQKSVDVPSNSSQTVIAMYDLTNPILREMVVELGNLEGADPTAPLTPQDLSAMSQIQKDIINARSLIGNVLTAADWSFGGIFDTTVGGLENVVSEVAAPFHVSWTWVVIAGVLVLGFIVFIKVV